MSAVLTYLDNAAATTTTEPLLDFFKNAALRCYVNQEAAHQAAASLREELDAAAAALGKLITGGTDYQACWTGSGTEGLLSALASCGALKGNIISTSAEHPALGEALKRSAATSRTELRTVGLLRDGQIDLEHFEAQLNAETSLVAVHHVQAETGAVQNLVALRKIIDSRAPAALFLTDTMQSLGKLRIPWAEARPDFAFAAGRKIGGPALGAVLYRDNAKGARRDFFASRRAKEHLASRPDPASVLTFCEASRLAFSGMPERTIMVSRMNDFLRNKLKSLPSQAAQRIGLTLSPELSSPYILHFTVEDCQGAVLVRMLGERGIALGAGSACAAESQKPSSALLAMGRTREEAFSGLRASFWKGLPVESLERFIAALADSLESY